MGELLEREPDLLKGRNNRCKDISEDCSEIPCKVSCWLYAPEEGYCPYLTGEVQP